MAVCELSSLGKAVRCQTRSSRHKDYAGLVFCLLQSHLLINAEKGHLCCPSSTTVFQLWDPSSQAVFAFTDVCTLFNTSENTPEASLSQMEVSVLVPCPLKLICPSCPCCQWATDGTGLETQHRGIWVTDGTAAEMDFLGRRDCNRRGFRENKSFGKNVTLPFL